jgi:soluble lytic murein transglycosylase-like protein
MGATVMRVKVAHSFRLLIALITVSGQTVYAKEIPEEYKAVSDYCGVPEKILYAVALAESGRVINRHFDAWPWTLNISGKGQYFASRAAQYTSLLEAIKNGMSVDIGPMQLNWKWQFERLGSPWQATDPTYNIITACRILRGYMNREDREINPEMGFAQWQEAVGRYHSPGSNDKHRTRAIAYANRVESLWRKL